jgi:hypothetical protein
VITVEGCRGGSLTGAVFFLADKMMVMTTIMSSNVMTAVAVFLPVFGFPTIIIS